jgi:hypothetical protein
MARVSFRRGTGACRGGGRGWACSSRPPSRTDPRGHGDGVRGGSERTAPVSPHAVRPSRRAEDPRTGTPGIIRASFLVSRDSMRPGSAPPTQQPTRRAEARDQSAQASPCFRHSRRRASFGHNAAAPSMSAFRIVSAVLLLARESSTSGRRARTVRFAWASDTLIPAATLLSLLVPCGRVPRGRGDARFSRFAEATEGHLRHLPFVRCQRLASLNRDASFHGGGLGAAAGLPPDAIASHAEAVEVKADPREEVGVGQGGQPSADP